MKKIIIILLVLAAGGYGGYRYFFSDKNKETIDYKQYVADSVGVIEKGTIETVVKASGKVIPNQEVEIKCKASGEVIELPSDVSDRVKKGDLLVKLDPVDEERSVKRAQVQLAVSKSRLKTAKINARIAREQLRTNREKAESDISSSEIAYRDASRDLERAKKLFAKDLVSREELDKAEAAQKQAELSLKSVRIRLEELKTSETALELKGNDIDVAEAQVQTDNLSLSDARQRLKDTQVYSPVDGVVSELSVRVGQIVSSGTSSVNSGTTIMKITDLSRMFTDVDVDESKISGVKTGQDVRISVESAGEREFAGKVYRVSPKGNRNRGVVKFPVRIEILEKDEAFLKPEMSTNIDIILARRDNVLKAPLASVIYDDKTGETFLKIKNSEGGFDKKPVEIGLSSGKAVEIVSGVKEGDEVLIELSAAESRWLSRVLDKGTMTKWRSGRRAGAQKRN